MGVEIDKLENHDCWVLYDTTSGKIIEFNDFGSFQEAHDILGREIRREWQKEQLINKFEDEIICDWDNDDNEIKTEIQKIKDYWSTK